MCNNYVETSFQWPNRLQEAFTSENETNISKAIARIQNAIREKALQKSFHTLDGMVNAVHTTKKLHIERT